MITHTTTSELMYSTMKSQTSSIVLGLSSLKVSTGLYEAGSWCSGTRRSPYWMTSYISLNFELRSCLRWRNELHTRRDLLLPNHSAVTNFLEQEVYTRCEASTEITLTSGWEYDDIPKMAKQTREIFRGRPDGIYSLYCLFVSDLDRASGRDAPPSPG